MWFRKKDTAADKSAQPAQDPIDVLVGEFRGPRYSEYIETPTGGTVHVDGLRTPPPEERQRVLAQAAELVDSGTPGAASILDLGLRDPEIGVRRMARSLWNERARTGLLSPEDPGVEVKAYVTLPVSGFQGSYDAQQFEHAEEGDTGAYEFALGLLGEAQPDWATLLTLRDDWDGEADWRAGDPVIAIGIAETSASEPATLASAQAFAEGVVTARASRGEAQPDLEVRLVQGHPSCVIDTSIASAEMDAEARHLREYFVFARSSVLGVAAQANDGVWERYEHHVDAFMQALKMPSPQTAGEDERLGGLSLSDFALKAMLEDVPPDRP